MRYLLIFLLFSTSAIFGEDWYFLRTKDSTCHLATNVDGTDLSPDILLKTFKGCKLSTYVKEKQTLMIDCTKEEKLKVNLIYTKTIEGCLTFAESFKKGMEERK